MVHQKCAAVISLLPLLAIPVLGQFSTTQIPDYCPNLSISTVLSGCSNFFNLPSDCNTSVISAPASEAEAALTSCFCQQSVVDVGSACLSEYSTCFGGEVATADLNAIFVRINSICSDSVVGGSSSATTSSKANGGGASATSPTPGSGATSAPSQPSATKPSSAMQNRPTMGLAALLAFCVTIGGLV